MANPYQQQVLIRKLTYVGLIFGLLLTAHFVRRYLVEKQARELGLLEESRGDVELVGAAARTGLSGLRGIATCALWMQATNEQMKNQYSNLERTVKQLTRLQPHLITPWQFQSWNLSYNVARDSDREGDKYFYIARGIQMLGQGERQNRYQPELRRDVGFFLQHKICQSDQTNALRSLFQLSCIPPVERDPERFRDAQRNINQEELIKFCKDHPQLARRLHSPPLPHDLRREHRKFRCANAREVVQFLEDNYNVPSLFVDRLESEQAWKAAARRDNPLDRFPILPPKREGAFNTEDPTAEDFVAHAVPDELDAHTVARAWYGYSQECVPPPGDIPGESQPIRNRLRERVPRNMVITVFRTSPARSQTFIAERLQEEGWYDDEPFVIDGWFARNVTIGVRRQWSAEAWRKAHQMWRKFAIDNHLIFEDVAQEKNKEAMARDFLQEFSGEYERLGRRFNLDRFDDRQKERYEAFRFMNAYRANQHLANLSYFLMRARVEQQEPTVKARKLFYQAEQARIVKQALHEAREKYEDPAALDTWREILEKNEDFRKDDYIQEQTFETELKYLRLYRRLHEDKLAPDLALLATLGQSVAGVPLSPDWGLTGLFSRPQAQPDFTIVGPFERDSEGKPFPFVPQTIKDMILVRRGLKKAPEQPTGPPSGLPGGPGMPGIPGGPPGGQQRMP